MVGFPGGLVVKSSPANAGDTGSVPGLGTSISLWAAKPVCPGACARQQEKPPQREACAPQLGSSPRSPQQEQTLPSKEAQSSQKVKNLKGLKIACWYRCGSDQMLLGNHP